MSGPWGSLSIVTDPYDTEVVTQPETPLLDYEGRPTGDTIEAAVTIELTEEQLDRAGSGNSFWIQGGTPADPILNEQYPDEYGFGALRCAIDNLNGDNVEWMSYPSGTEHIFCYAYYVTPPPTSGTIIIRKQVSDPPGADQNFQFGGNLTFNADGRFDLNVQDGNTASQTFYRAETGSGTHPGRSSELVPPGWNLVNLVCESPGASTEVVTQAPPRPSTSPRVTRSPARTRTSSGCRPESSTSARSRSAAPASSTSASSRSGAERSRGRAPRPGDGSCRCWRSPLR